MTAKYNILYNGEVAYLEGLETQVKGNKDNYTEFLPMYISQNKATQSLGKSNYETAILKSEKAIKLHSIKKRPVIKGNQRKTPKQKAYLARKEFNPYLWHAWLLLADSQFNEGEFFEAASTYNYIIRLYGAQPEIANLARARMARCYIALDWPYDAEDILKKMQRDSIGIRGERERDNSTAAWMVMTKQYKEAIPYLKKSISHQRGRILRARLNYLLAQLYRETGQNGLAYKAWGRVIRANPPYEMSFNAQIARTEVMSKGKGSQMIRRLKRMAKNDNNQEYLDQIYYAIGNIYLTNLDTTHCIYAWEKGAKESMQNGTAKARLLLRLSNLYWEMENYIDAARTYKDCIAILDKEHEQYKETERRSKALEPLAPHLETVKLQDSLQALAKLPEKEYLAAIDRVIEALKKKEKEDAKRADNQAATAQASANAAKIAQNNSQGATTSTQRKGAWYFYNQQTILKGKQEFEKTWGKRANEDNWRLSSKPASDTDSDSANPDSLTNNPDSINGGGGGGSGEGDGLSDKERALQDSLANDPHHREYYLKQIPFTDEQMEQSHSLLMEALYNAGIMEEDKVENFPMAKKTLERLMRDYPDYENMEEVYYYMFLICGRMGLEDEAMKYRDMIVQQYPDGKRGKLLGNPNYDMIARGGKHLEDSLYTATYDHYLANEYDKVMDNYKFSSENFPEGKNRARFMFVNAMSQLYTGQRDSFLVSLKQLIEKYPKEEITELANSIVKGLKDGRLLAGSKLNATGIWGRRTRSLDGADADSTANELKPDPFTNFYFVLAYPTGSLDEDQLLFEVARYNFTAFMVRNFELEISDLQGISMLVVKGFLNFDEVHSYAQQLYSDRHMARALEGIKSILISEENFKLLGVDFSFDEYQQFYDSFFGPMQVPEDLRIDDNQILRNEDEDTEEETQQKEKEKENATTTDDDDFPFGF